MHSWVNVREDNRIPEKRNQSPLMKSLFKATSGESVVRSLISENIGNALQNRDEIIDDHLGRILHWRNRLDESFGDDVKKRDFCVSCLGYLISARFSGHAQSFDAFEWTLERLMNCMSERRPVTFTFCFGGYKNHHSPSHPEVDWAELFHLNFMASYLWPLVKAYPYGVILEYESEEVSIQYNNVPQQLTDKYTRSFQLLLDYYTFQLKHQFGELPLSFKLTLARDYYADLSELDRLIQEKTPEYEALFSKLSSEEQAKWLQRAESNFMYNGVVKYDRESLTSAQHEKLIRTARITNEAFLDADYVLRQAFFEDPHRIPIVGTWGRMPSAQVVDGWIHLKSTRASLVDFWIGTGCIEFLNSATDIENGSYREEILSESQLSAKEDTIQFVNNDDELLKAVSSNFMSIRTFQRITS